MKKLILFLALLAIVTPVLADCFGAECNPTGDPVGGGVGYSRIISQTDPNVKYVVSTKEQLISALKNAKPRETVFVNGTAVIDMNGTSQVVIPAGVTLASDRGLAGSSGALITKKTNTTPTQKLCNEATFIAKNNTRITGLRLEGEMKPQDDASVPYAQYLMALKTEQGDTMEVDNCEIYGWSYSAVQVGDRGHPSGNGYVHHNFIHSNQARGLGYGIEVYGGSALIEANIFEYNRHSICGAGMEGENYEARYNHELSHVTTSSHRFDVHPNPNGKQYSGSSYMIHHNTFESFSYYDIMYRGAEPEVGVWIDHNIFNWAESRTTRPVYSYSTLPGIRKTHVSDNLVGIPPTELKRDWRGVVQFKTAIPWWFWHYYQIFALPFGLVTT